MIQEEKLKKSSVGSYVKLDIRKFKSYRSICIIDDFEDPLQRGNITLKLLKKFSTIKYIF